MFYSMNFISYLIQTTSKSLWSSCKTITSDIEVQESSVNILRDVSHFLELSCVGATLPELSCYDREVQVH